MDDEVELELDTAGPEDWEDLRAAAAESDVEIVEARNLEPFTTLIIVGGVLVLAGVVAKWIRRQRDRADGRACGQLIDLRPEAADPVRRDEALDYGQIVIISPTEDGKDVRVDIRTYDPDNDFTRLASDIFGKLSEGVAKSIDAVKNAIEAATGDRGQVSVAEVPSGA